jgi:hypothetical protein
MRPFRPGPALISLLLLHSSFIAVARAQTAPAPPPKAEDDAASEEEQEAMDEEEEGRKPPASADAPQAAPPAPEPADIDEAEMSDAELEAEAEKELAAEAAAGAAALTRPPAKGKGAVVGVVKDALEHDTMPEAQISVVGTKIRAIADIEGRYRLELPPGTYTLRIYVELHKPSVVKGVEVKLGQLERFDIDVVPDEASVDTVEIVTEVDKSSVEGLLLTRQRSASVGDGVGRAEISRTPASNAAQAAQRVPGIIIVGNRFVYVRGLGERYTNSLLNGSPLPSPEPDRAAIPLDLFPTLVLESVNIVKTFTPDIPADFAGGSVQIQTREIPTKALFQLSAGLGFDTSATFQDRLAHTGSKTDWLGYDGGTRSLPDGFPDYVLQKQTPKPGNEGANCRSAPERCIGDEDLINAGRLLNSSMNPKRESSLPNYSVSAVGGNGWAIGEEQRAGVLATFNYGRSFRTRESRLQYFRPDIIANPDGSETRTVVIDRSLDVEQGEDRVNWGGMATGSYWLDRSHRFSLTFMHTQLADAATRFSFLDYQEGQHLANGQLRYVSRAMNVAQLRGEHDFAVLNKAALDWNAYYSVANRDEPDTRNTVYQLGLDNVWNPVGETNGSHLFAGQTEKSIGAGLNWTQPLLKDPEDLKLKVGGAASKKTRDFAARRFLYSKNRTADASLFSCPGPDYDLDCPNPVYQWANIGETLDFKETTFASDSYEAGLKVYAGYAMLDVRPSPMLRVIAGARVERTNQFITPYSQFTTGEPPKGARIESTDVLPALSMTLAASKRSNLRVGLSKTLARPQIRELSPFVYSDYFGAFPQSGNPDLKLTYIENADLRFETFPTLREVLAFSLFYKVFDAPIEPYVEPSGAGIISFQNADGARLVGMELEGRKTLGFISDSLKDFTAIANLTLAHSEIDLDDSKASLATNRERPMVNQAPYVLNLALDYSNEALGFDVRVLSNVIGPSIVEVGTGGLPDAYRQPQPTLDATVGKKIGKHLQFKLNGTNLLGSPTIVTLGKENDAKRRIEETDDGRIFAITGSYTY